MTRGCCLTVTVVYGRNAECNMLRCCERSVNVNIADIGFLNAHPSFAPSGVLIKDEVGVSY